MTRHLISSILAILLLTGCSISSTSDVPENRIADAFAPQEFPLRFRALLQANAETLQFGFSDSGRNGNLLLEQRRDGFDTWLGADGAAVILQRGMLHGTRGLGAGLLASELSQPLAMVLSGQEGVSDRFHTFLTGNDKAVTRTYRCEIENRGAREINIGARAAQTGLMVESCRSLDQEFTNFYWVENNSSIVQSRQWTGDYLGPITLRVVAR